MKKRAYATANIKHRTQSSTYGQPKMQLDCIV